MPDTGGWQTWQTVSGSVSSVTGLHDLYLVFKGGTSIGNVNWFRFDGARRRTARSGDPVDLDHAARVWPPMGGRSPSSPCC